jgi:hypothetical protein
VAKQGGILPDGRAADCASGGLAAWPGKGLKLRGRHAEKGRHAWTVAAIHGSFDEPSPFMDIELHRAFVSHFQQERLASFLVRDIGAFHDFVDFERLLSKRHQDIFSIIQHDETPPANKRANSLKVRQLIFRYDSLDIPRLAPDTVSKTSICLDGHALNDGVNHCWISCCTSLWTLGLVANVFIQLIGI